MPCSTISLLASSTRSSAYFTVWISCPQSEVFKPFKSFLLSYLLYTLNRIGDKHLYLTPLPIFTYWPPSGSSLNFNALIHNLPINSLHASQYQFPWESALIWANLHSQKPSAHPWRRHTILHVPKVCSDTILSIMFTILFSIPFLSILATSFAVCAMVAAFCSFRLLL